MKKIFLLIVVMFLLASCGFAAKKGASTSFLDEQREIRFKDVPDSHWAAKAVYRMVKLGVTQGYPDGTFRGAKSMTRFETAMFLSKLADNFGSTGIDKLSAELKSEFQSMKEEIDNSNRIKAAGQFELDYYLSDVFTTATDSLGNKVSRVPLLSYRLTSAFTSNLDNNGSIKINLDTMDGGFYGGSQDIATKMLDVTGIISFESAIPLTLTATAGPGPQQHLTGQNEVPSEYGKTYIRPYSGIKLDSKLANADIGIAYQSHNISSALSSVPGMIGVNQVTVQIGWPYEKIAFLNKGYVLLTGDNFSKNTLDPSSGLSNTKASLSITSCPADAVKLTGEIKAGHIRNISSKDYVCHASADFSNFVIKDSSFGIGLTAAGANYIIESTALDEWTMIGFDPFLRPRVNGCRSFDAYFTKTVSSALKLTAKGVLDMSSDYKFGQGYQGSRSTIEGGINVSLGSRSEANLLYRVENTPNATDTTTDLFTFAVISRF